MGLLPALALFAALALGALELRWKGPGEDLKSRVGRLLYPVALGAALLNPAVMLFGASAAQLVASVFHHNKSTALAIYSPPLVLKEAIVNSTTRVPFERNLAVFFEQLPPGASILMEQSAHVGALQDAGIPLRNTINETDYESWNAALQNPASRAEYVVAFEGDQVAKAVAEHPDGLLEVSIISGTGQRSAHIYLSQKFGNAPAQ
jgi:hypothetical protein